MIAFEHVTKRYGERLALDDVSWRMDEGECGVVLGHSAAGKTTLLRLITHETQPTSGTVAVGTFRGGRLPRGHRALLRRTIGVVYEDFRLLADRSVFENVALAVRIAGHFADHEVVPRTMRALEEVGLTAQQTALPSELSFGERQRCAITPAASNSTTSAVHSSHSTSVRCPSLPFLTSAVMARSSAAPRQHPYPKQPGNALCAD